MVKYKYNVKYKTPPLMGEGEGFTTITETVICDNIEYNYNNPDSNKTESVDFIEIRDKEDNIESEVVKLSVKFDCFISATKEKINE